MHPLPLVSAGARVALLLACAFLASPAPAQVPPGPALPLDVTTALGPGAMALTSFTGREAIGEPFRFELELRSGGRDPVDYESLLGQPVSFNMQLPGQARRFFHGICTRISAGDIDATDGAMEYEMRVEPALALLRLNRAMRIFADKSLPVVLETLLRGRGIEDIDIDLLRDYRVREFITQYKESDFEFISRLMEEEGIYYYFVHAAGKHTMAVRDRATNESGGAPYTMQYDPDQPFVLGRIYAMNRFIEVRAGRVALDDYDYIQPNADLLTSATAPSSRFTAATTFEDYDFPGGYSSRFDGARRAEVAMERIVVQHEGFDAQSGDSTLRPAMRIVLAGHADARFNGGYLITSVQHRASVDDEGVPEYQATLAGVDAALPYLPPRRTPFPVVQGQQTAVVVEGADADPDHLYRVKVRFPWMPQAGPDASVWMRVAQQNTTGAAAPEPDDEVLVVFEHGDINRPVVLGRLFNGNNPPPSEMSVQPLGWLGYGR